MGKARLCIALPQDCLIMEAASSSVPLSGFITFRGLHRNRVDSRTGYLPRIDIPELGNSSNRPPPTDLSDLVRANHPYPSPPRGPAPATARACARREDFWRVGNKLDSWRAGDLNKYKCKLPVGGGTMPHPGLLLPEVLSTSQCLFGPTPTTTGTP